MCILAIYSDGNFYAIAFTECKPKSNILKTYIICHLDSVDVAIPTACRIIKEYEVLRTRQKVEMKIDFTEKERVQRSLNEFYLCKRLLDKLSAEVQLSLSPIVFANSLRKINFLNL